MARQPLLRSALLGHVVALGEDAGDLAVGILDWLVDEIDVSPLGLAVRAALDEQRLLTPDERLAGAKDVVEQVEEALAFQLGQRFAHAAAE